MSQQGFGAFDVDGEIIVDEEDGNLPPSLLAELSRGAAHSLRFVGAKRMESPKSGYRAELAAIRAAAPDSME